MTEKDDNNMKVTVSNVGEVFSVVERIYKPDPIVMNSISNSRVKTCLYFKYKCLLIFILGILGIAQFIYFLISKLIENEKIFILLDKYLKTEPTTQSHDYEYEKDFG